MKRSFTYLILAAVAIWAAVLSLPDNKLRVVFCDVGQGDATIIIKGTVQILIDGGPDDRVLGCLAEHIPFWDRKIEMAILTHDNSDHSVGLTYVANRYTVNRFVREDWAVGQQIKAGDLKLTVIGIDKTENQGEVMTLEYGKFKVLFTADVIADLKMAVPANVLKVSHHGSKFGTTSEWLDIVQPQVAMISVGKNNYGHPAPEVLKLLQDANAKILRTDMDGEVEVTSDGETYSINSKI